MQPPLLHRFEAEGKCFAIDTQTCFCFECDSITRDVLEWYPQEPVNRIYHLLEGKYPRKDLEEVVGELEWLRVTKAILSPPGDQELLDLATRTGGLGRVVLMMDNTPGDEARAAQAGRLLLARSVDEKNLALSLRFPNFAPWDWTALASTLDEIRGTARLADKRLRIEVDIPFRPLQEMRGEPPDHIFRSRLTPADAADLAGFFSGISALANGKPKAALDVFQKKAAPERVRIVAVPGSASFHGLVETLHKAGYTDIVLDIPSAWASGGLRDPEAVTDALRANAAYFADQMLRNTVFRVEPLASLFNTIHTGTPVYRRDKSGIEALAADSDGCLYPSPAFAGNPEFALGTLAGGTLSEAAREPFLLSGALQIPACLRCWARGLCGGGHAAIHHARTGCVRTPDDAWCDAQRRWCEIAVAAFHRISSSGVNFSHLVSAMQPKAQHISLFTAAKAIFQGRLGVRPLREDDAALLVRWQNWNRAAYFVCNDAGTLTATQYDREMDALHPPPQFQELVLTRRDGAPCGLVKLYPVPERRLALAWLYLHDPALYAKSGVSHTLRDLLAEVCRAGQLRHVITPVTGGETALAGALLAAGFTHAGTQREALYQRGGYQDVHLYKYAVDA